jgi:hypothetical protein
MSTVRITGHSAATGNDLYDVDIDGVPYKYEVWSTENSSGATWTTLDRTWVDEDPIPEDEVEAFDALIDAYVQLFYPLWHEKVEPVITEVVTTVISRLDEAKTCKNCGMLIWQDKGSWVDATEGDGCNDADVHQA